jgi:DtxR family Mn-dependent transcriptional regulator
MTEKISPTIEDYLMILFILHRDGEAVQGVRLAELLGVSPPTVTNTLKRMVARWAGEHGQRPRPPPDGLRMAAARTVMRRHMLTEWLLSRMLSWSKVHLQAHEIEHAISDELETALMADLNHPTTCPHGNPLPGYEALTADWVALVHLRPGDEVIIRRIHELAEEDSQLLRFLEEKSVVPGSPARVVEVLPFNQTVTLEVNGQAVTLGFAAAQQVFAERLAPQAV